MTLLTGLLVLLLGVARAEDAASPLPGAGLPVDDPAPAEDPAGMPAVEPPTEGIWAWVSRLEGEVLSEEAFEALRERAEAAAAEGALEDELGAPDVPLEVYDDPSTAVASDPLRLDEIDPSAFDIPVTVNADVRRWMRYFLGPGRAHFERYLGRSATYRPLIEARLREAGLPEDLVYLAMIESGFNAHALSRAGAAGLWQFMPATGRMYDLRVDWWVDDRRDPVKATDAAVAHLADLHKMFGGDWLLAWSAYNAGPGRVRRAMEKGGTRDFWALAEGRHLPSETANYAPKLIAAAILAENADRYGFTVEPKPVLEVDVVDVDGGASLDVLARCAGIDVEALRKLNPGLRRWATPAEGYRLNLPHGTAASFAQRFAEVPEAERVRFAHHTVVRGDTLGGIATRYGVTTKEIVDLNHLADANRIVVGMSLIVPRSPSGEPEEAATAAVLAAPPTRPESHTVAAGESLSIIAARFSVSTADLRTWNGLDTDVIRAGQVLRLRPAAVATGAAPEADRIVKYTVVAGDTLSGIAARYGVTAGDLQRWNRLGDAGHIRVGQVLEVRRATWRVVEVRPGDSLGRIASEQGCTVEQLRTWNDLSGDLIRPGQKLRVRR